MAISEALLPEYDMEMASTRKILERIDDEKFSWKPHEKSYSMGDLATHVATLPLWGVMTVHGDHYDVTDPNNPPPAKAANKAEVLAMFDKSAADAREAIAGADDAVMMQPWSLKADGAVKFTMPKAAVLRSFVMNHMIHHRAQLGMYLRLNNIALPQVYGPTADENSM